MTAVEAKVEELVRRGFQLWPEGSNLRYRVPPDSLATTDLEFLRAHKAEVLQLLDGRRVMPLSGTQERLWFLTTMDTSGIGYLFGGAYRIDGLTDVAAFTAAVANAVARHDALHVSFDYLGDAPVQFVETGFLLHTPMTDCRSLSSRELGERMRSELMHPGKEVIRSALFRTGEYSYVWGLILHHLVADGRTLRVIVDDVSDRLCGVARSEVLGFADFLAWDSLRSDTCAADDALRYWTAELDGFQDVDLIPDHPRPPVRGYAGGRLDLTMPAELVTAVDEFAREASTTRFTIQLAVYFALLSIYTDSDDLTVGTPHVNRADLRFDWTAGCFVSTQVLRTQLDDDPDLAELVARVAETTTRAWEHRAYSYEEVVARLRPERDVSRNPLFSTFFAAQEPPADLRVPGAHTAAVALDTGVVQFDLELHVTPAADNAVTVTVLYNSDLFERASAHAFGERYIELTRLALAQPDLPVRKLPLRTGSEATTAANDTAAPFDLDVRVDELVRAAADRHPDRQILVSGDRGLTYRELMGEVDALAARLGELGVPRIGIALQRGPDMVIAVLAAMSSGLAFVPLDPTLPAQRLAWMIEDSALRYAITGSDVVLPVELGTIPVEARPTTEPAALDTSAGKAAYVMFTSGSTGRPKGVEVSHRNLTNLICSMLHEPGLTPDDVYVTITTLSFDISLLEILAPLVAGATLVVATQTEAKDPVALASLLDSSAATVMQATPSHWQMLLDGGWKGRAELTAWCGGEALSRDLAEQLIVRCAGLWNLYGPTETTIWSTRWRVERHSAILLGRPIENTRCYVVNSAGVPVPSGVPGELYIAGSGVAMGYVGRPEETARRFVGLSIAPDVTEQAYRTGDLVRQLPDGSLAYLGRTDLQMKVRGHRIEPEEVERVLRAGPGVRDAVVTLSPDGALVGHLRPEAGGQVVVEALRAHATVALPSHQVPQRFVVLEDFPTIANGKIDRKALAALPPDPTPHTGESPANDVEDFIAELFRDILKVDQVGRDSDFFDLGGHSLLAPRLLYRIELKFDVRMPIHHLFMYRTVADLATALRAEFVKQHQQTRAVDEAMDIIDAMSDQELSEFVAR